MDKKGKEYTLGSEKNKSISREYGEVFREFREMKGYSMIQVYRDVCDRKTLWNFEVAGTCISLKLFMKLLRNINVSEEEFFAVAHRNCLIMNEKFFEIVYDYYMGEDVFALKEVLEKQKRNYINLGSAERNWNIFILSGLINNLDSSFVVTDEVIEASLDYLLAIETWQTCDLWFFACVVHLVNINLSCSIVESLIKSDEIFRAKSLRKKRFIGLLINIAHVAIENNCLIEAKNFMDVAKMLFPLQRWSFWNFLGEHYAFRFVEGELKFVCGDETGKAQMIEVIDHLSFLDQKKMKELYQKLMNDLL